MDSQVDASGPCRSPDRSSALAARRARLIRMRPGALSLVAAVITAGCGHPAPSTVGTSTANARHAPLAHRLQLALDSARVANRYPGISLGLVLSDGTVLGLTSGFEDTARRAPLT